MLSFACGLWGDGSCFAKQIFVISAAVGLALVQLRCFHERHGMQLNTKVIVYHPVLLLHWHPSHEKATIIFGPMMQCEI